MALKELRSATVMMPFICNVNLQFGQINLQNHDPYTSEAMRDA